MVCSSEIRAVVNSMSVVDRGGGGGSDVHSQNHTNILLFFDNLALQILPLQIHTLHTELYSAGRFGKSYSTMFYQDCSKSLMGVHNPDMYFR